MKVRNNVPFARMAVDHRDRRFYPTVAQAETLEFIYKFTAFRGESPTLQDVAEAFGLESREAGFYRVKGLMKIGAVRKPRRNGRGLTVTDWGRFLLRDWLGVDVDPVPVLRAEVLDGEIVVGRG